LPTQSQFRTCLPILLLTFLSLGACTVSLAQPNARDSAAAAQAQNYFVADADLPPEVKTKFRAQYPKAVGPTWVRNFNYFEVKFSQNSRELISSYSSVGEWVKTEIILRASELPLAVTQYMTEFDPEGVIETARVEITPIGRLYQMQTSKKNQQAWLYYDVNGVFLRADIVLSE
jgi:hypothetical protein